MIIWSSSARIRGRLRGEEVASLLLRDNRGKKLADYGRVRQVAFLFLIRFPCSNNIIPESQTHWGV